MNYIIRKTVAKQFYYYLGIGGKWEGLISNAIASETFHEAKLKVAILKDKYPKDKFEIIKKY